MRGVARRRRDRPDSIGTINANARIRTAVQITRDQLMSNMKVFAQSLGVRCVHCHVGEEGKPLSTFDFASDAKKEKQVARKMLTMVHRINSADFAVTDFKNVKVTCFTCHRGATKPLTAPPPPPAAT